MRWYYALAFVLALQMFMFLAQEGISRELGTTVNLGDHSYYQSYDGGNYTLKSNINDYLPSSGGSIDTDTGVLYTDQYSVGKSWIQSDSRNTNYLTAPYDMMISLGFENYVAFSLATFWYVLISALVLYQFLRGGA